MFDEINSNADSFAIAEGRKKAEPARSGFAVGVPIGGSSEYNSGESGASGPMDRVSFMETMQQSYLTCTWSAASVDTIARTATAGGLEVVPVGGVYSNLKPVDATPEVKKVQELLRYVNPYQDIRQLMRGVVTDLQVFGDSFTEVVWSKMGEPVALYSLDPTTITILANEHGMIKGYYQKTQTNREAWFLPKEVIHVKSDSPGDTLYGVSPTQKAILPITTWLFASALLKETYKRGDPLRAWVDWPIALPESEMKKFQQQYSIRNLGVKNIGNLFETKGGAVVKELGANQISFWHQTLQERRDEIIAAYGVPPSKVGIVEAGNIGGGTGTPFSLDTLIPTPSGWTTMGEISIGDIVFDENGKQCPVTRIYEVPNAKAWEAQFSDGTSVICGDDHLWTAWSSKQRKMWEFQSPLSWEYPDNWASWSPKPTTKSPYVLGDRTKMREMRASGMSAAEVGKVFGKSEEAIKYQWLLPEKVDKTIKPMRFGDMVNQIKTHNGYNFTIPAARPLQIGEDTPLPIDPYVLGYLLGDGATDGSGCVACHQDDKKWLIEEFEAAGYATTERAHAQQFGIRNIRNIWRNELELHNGKYIPSFYFRASYDQRLALIQGLIDSDGHVNKKGSFCFDNTNRVLIDGFCELVRSLGAIPLVSHNNSRTVERTGYDKPTLESWTVRVSTELPLARIPRKINKARTQWKLAQKARHIVGARSVETQDMRCIEVDSSNHLFLVGEGMIPTHNSQDKTYRVNTIGPVQEIVLEKFSFSLMYQAYGITDWTLKFGVVDWRDDETIELIRDQRIRNGTWTLDRAREDIGEPPTPGGDKPVLVDRQNMVLWEDLDDLSKANIAAAQASSIPSDGTSAPAAKKSRVTGKNAMKGPDTGTKGVKRNTQAATPQQAPKPPGGSESFDEDDDDDGDYTYHDNGSRTRNF
jgi:hypothetical protein